MDVKIQEDVIEVFENFSIEETEEILEAVRNYLEDGNRFVVNTLELIDRSYVADVAMKAVDSFKAGMREQQARGLKMYGVSFGIGVVATTAGIFGYNKVKAWKDKDQIKEI